MKETSSSQGQMSELQQFLVAAIKGYVAESPLNKLTKVDNSPIWEEPLVGFADGDDPLFDLYKTVIDEKHLTPREALAEHVSATTGGEPPAFPRVGVVSWILPAAKETKLSNRKMTDGPSQRWNNTRFQGEDFNDTLRAHVVKLLEERGYTAVAPMKTGFFKTFSGPYGRSSNWSERHAAYAAGHGTFSLSDGLITAKGVAIRCGNVVVNAEFVPSERKYTHHLEYCPYLNDGSCGDCIKRCPSGAITPSGHDKEKCREFMSVTQVHWTQKPGYMGHYSACGLCQTKVPCESGIPRRTGIIRIPKPADVLVKG